MTRDEIRATVLRALGEIAPEADLASLAPDVEFREQLDLDSMDFLNFVVGLHAALGVDIPESDYPKLATLDGCVEYLGRAGRVRCTRASWSRVDGSSTADAALREALELARDAHGRVRIVHVIDSPYDYPDVMFVHVAGDMEDLRQAWQKTGQAVLDRALAVARARCPSCPRRR